MGKRKSTRAHANSLLGSSPTSISPENLALLNSRLGFPEGSPSGYRWDSIKNDFVLGDPKGTRVLTQKQINLLSDTEFDAYINDAAAFPNSLDRNGIKTGINQNFVDDATFDANVKSSKTASTNAKTNNYFGTADKPYEAANLPGTTKNTNWQKLVTALKLATGITLTAKLIDLLGSDSSACYLQGPNGEEEKIGDSESGCNCTTGTLGELKCCQKCQLNGDATACPGDVGSTFSNTYNCTEANKDVENQCYKCGCSTNDWKLCFVEKDILDVIGDMLASVGKILVDAGNGILDIADNILDVFLEPLKIFGYVVAGVVGFVVLAIIIYFVVKIVRQRNRLPSSF
jgi:hypothetical protein